MIERTARARRTLLRLHLPPPARDEPAGLGWMVNGYRADVHIWTAEEWATLEDRPPDAQPHPSGVWAALRMA